MKRSDRKAIGAIFMLNAFSIVGFKACADTVVSAAKNPQFTNYGCHFCNSATQPIMFWVNVSVVWANVIFSVGGMLLAALFFFATNYGAYHRAKYGNGISLKGRTGQNAAPVIDETKRSSISTHLTEDGR